MIIIKIIILYFIQIRHTDDFPSTGTHGKTPEHIIWITAGSCTNSFTSRRHWSNIFGPISKLCHATLETKTHVSSHSGEFMGRFELLHVGLELQRFDLPCPHPHTSNRSGPMTAFMLYYIIGLMAKHF